MNPYLGPKLVEWARRTTPRQWLVGTAVAIAVIVALLWIETVFGWPEALTVNSTGRRDVPLP